jgi:cytoskeletal protein RodZ
MPVQGLTHDYPREVGVLLKSARTAQALDCSEIALKIALSPSQLRFLEEGETESFYNRLFYLQAARRYAAFLGITLPEPETSEPVASLPEPSAEPPAPTREEHHHTPLKQSGKTPWLITAAALGVMGIGIFSMLQPDRSANTTIVSAGASTSVAAPTAVPDPAPAPATEPASPAAAPVPAPSATPTTPPAAVSAPAPVVAVPTPVASAPPAADSDSKLVNSVGTWVQIVGKDGSKTNLRIQAGEPVQFTAQETAAIAFGRPGTASLTIRGSAVSIERFLVQEASPARALVILRDL